MTVVGGETFLRLTDPANYWLICMISNFHVRSYLRWETILGDWESGFQYIRDRSRSIKIRSMEILWNKIEEIQKGASRPPCNSDFINKIEGRSNTEFSQPQFVLESQSKSILQCTKWSGWLGSIRFSHRFVYKAWITRRALSALL